MHFIRISSRAPLLRTLAITDTQAQLNRSILFSAYAAGAVANQVKEIAGKAALLTGAAAAVYQIYSIYGEYDRLTTKRMELKSKLETLIAKNEEQGITLGTNREAAGLLDVQSNS